MTWHHNSRHRTERTFRQPSLRVMRRRAFTLLELVVAMTVFGIILMGIFPLVVMQSRAMKKLERRSPTDKTWYLVPATDPWAQKLGAAASVVWVDPGPPAAAEDLIVDDGSGGYSQSDNGWTLESDGSSQGGSYRWHDATAGAEQTASWTLGGLTAGWYDVRLTWVANASRASNASLNVYDGDNLAGTYTLDERSDPTGEVVAGRPWQSLAAVPIRSGLIRVQLSTEADGQVAADAILLVPIHNVVNVLSFDHSLSSEDVTARALVQVQVPQ